MAQVSKISQLNVGNLVASSANRTVSSKSDFSKIMSSNTTGSRQQTQNDGGKESVLTTKQKLQETNAAASKLNADDKTVSDQVVDTKSLNSETPEQKLDTVQEQVAELKEEIAKVLDITVDELEKFMTESGLTVMNLLEPNMLQMLLLQVNGVTEQTDLLTNENLCNQLSDLLETVQEFTETVDIDEFTKVNELITGQGFSELIQENAPHTEAETEISQEQPGELKTSNEASSTPVITVQKEVAENTNRDSDSKRNTDEHGENQHAELNQFVQNLSNSVQNTSQIQTEGMERIQVMQEIVNQVVDKIKIVLGSDSTSMELQLNPEHLGKVNLSVIAKNGEMTATFTVENQLAKEALESQMTTLRENLNEQGIKVEAIEVTVAQQGLSQDQFSNQSGQNFQNQAKRQHHARNIQNEDDLDEETEEESGQSIRSNGTVEFSA